MITVDTTKTVTRNGHTFKVLDTSPQDCLNYVNIDGLVVDVYAETTNYKTFTEWVEKDGHNYVGKIGSGWFETNGKCQFGKIGCPSCQYYTICVASSKQN